MEAAAAARSETAAGAGAATTAGEAGAAGTFVAAAASAGHDRGDRRRSSISIEISGFDCSNKETHTPVLQFFLTNF